jgi:proteasome beta subunit
MRPGSGSFTEFLTDAAPHLLPTGRHADAALAALPHGTTIVAVTCAD